MPEPSILLCGPARDADESAASLALLRTVTLPSAAKYLVTTGKFDGEGEAKTVNVEADYPDDPPHLQTLLRWAEAGNPEDPRYRDAYDLYCLRRILTRSGKADYAVVLREGANRFQERWPEIQGSLEGRLFLTFDDGAVATGSGSRPSLLVNLQDDRSPAFLDAVWELYRTGAIYGMEDYTFEKALTAAVEAVELELRLFGSVEGSAPQPLADAQDPSTDRLAASGTD